MIPTPKNARNKVLKHPNGRIIPFVCEFDAETDTVVFYETDLQGKPIIKNGEPLKGSLIVPGVKLLPKE